MNEKIQLRGKSIALKQKELQHHQVCQPGQKSTSAAAIRNFRNETDGEGFKTATAENGQKEVCVGAIMQNRSAEIYTCRVGQFD